MAIQIKGYYKLPQSPNVQLIDFALVFHTSFMRKFTKYKTFEKFLLGGKFHITCQKDFEDLPEEQMDLHVMLLLAVFVLALPKTFAKTCSHVLPHNGLKFGTSQDAKL